MGVDVEKSQRGFEEDKTGDLLPAARDPSFSFSFGLSRKDAPDWQVLMLTVHFSLWGYCWA